MAMAATAQVQVQAQTRAKPTPPRYTVVVTLSAKAAAKLTALREGVVVAAVYYGEPTKAAAKQADEVGQIDLGHEDVALPAAGGAASFVGRGFQAARLGWVVGGAAQININVFSARKSGPDNLLDCDLFEDAVTVAEAKPIAIACKLIGEP